MYTVKPLYSEHQRDPPKSVHYRRCSLYRGYVVTELYDIHVYIQYIEDQIA